MENIIIADQSFAYANGAIICGTIPVAIGDSYKDGHFYRDGEQLVADQTEIEKLKQQINDLNIAMAAIIGGAI